MNPASVIQPTGREFRMRFGSPWGWLLVVLFAWTGCASSDQSEAYSGTLRIDAPDLGSVLGGTVVDLRVQDGDHVRRGTLLARFDDARQRAEEAHADAEQHRSAAQLALLEAGTRDADLRRARAQEQEAHQHVVRSQADAPVETTSATADLQRAQADLSRAQATKSQARRDYQRAWSLWSSGDLSRAAAEAARLQERQSQAQVENEQAVVTAAQRRASFIQASVNADVAAMKAAYRTSRETRVALDEGARPQEIAAAKAALQSAAAQLNDAKAARAQLVIRAPADGTIEDVAIRVGDVVGPGIPVMTLIPAIDPYVRVYVPQRRLGSFGLGKVVRVRSDAFPDRFFTGRVEQIDRQAQFIPRDVQTPEDRADVDFGVKVSIADPQRLLRSGTTAEVLP
ncbi:MAG TPA: HlyD family efflux transporter periplasmic adaptor subunit [Candidatus Baltobacteraceae bacterium]|nr:HlyD family efflux transporter periplasmic adaptor subunit [Candidatus Baltobacteraceae bacterium]